MSQHGVWLPRRVHAGVISEVLGDGTAVVVQLDSQQAHSLDALAAKVWELADGTRSVTAVALAAGVPAERVEAILAQLAGLGLLEDDAVGGHSRRSVLARAAQVSGGLVLAGGVINSMALPAAAAGLSTTDQTVLITYVGPGDEDFGYQDEGTGSVQSFSTTIYLTDTGVVGPGGTAPSSGPYVEIEPYGASAGEILVAFESQGTTGAAASYGTPPTDLTTVAYFYPGSTGITVRIGTGS